MPNVHFSFRRGAGDVPEILYGKVEIKPTLAFARGTSLVLPAPTTLDLVNGEATANNVYPTPAPVAGQVEWAYRIKAIDTRGQSFEWMVGVPDSTGTVEFTSLPRYFETKPPLFGKGEKGDPGEAAKITVGTTTSGTTPSVTNSGTNQHAILDFVLPQGPQGPKGDGVSFEYAAETAPVPKLFSDAPSTYPGGVTEGLYGANATTGWPLFGNTSGFVKVVTHRHTTYAASAFQIISRYQSDNLPLIRHALSSDSWSPTRELASSDLATNSANGLMSSADKAKLDGIGTLAYASKKASDLAGTYPEGTTVGAFKTADGWPVIPGGDPDTITVKTEVPRGYPMATQWAYAYKNDTAELETSSPVMYRAGFGALGWGSWQTLATTSYVDQKISYVTPEQFGAVGNGTADDSDALESSIAYAMQNAKTVLLDPQKTYGVSRTITNTVKPSTVTEAGKLVISIKSAQEGRTAKIRVLDSAPDSAATRVLDFSGTVLATSPMTGSTQMQTRRWMAGVGTYFKKGMLFGVESSASWYYDPRPDSTDARKSEVHRIDSSDPVNSRYFYSEAPAFDGYVLSEESVTLYPIIPIRVYLKDLEVERALPAEGTSADNLRRVGINITYADDSKLENVSVYGGTAGGIKLVNCYDSHIVGGKTLYSNNYYEGYGVQIGGSTFCSVEDRYFASCRRGVDISQGTRFVSRHNAVRRCKVVGGGKNSRGTFYNYSPVDGSLGDAQSGMGTHGPSDFAIYEENIILDCHHAITCRGSNEIVRNNQMYGRYRLEAIAIADGGGVYVIDGNVVGTGWTGTRKNTSILDGGANINSRRAAMFLHIYPNADTARMELRVSNNYAEVQDYFIQFGSAGVASACPIRATITGNTVLYATTTATTDRVLLYNPMAGETVSGLFRWTVGPNAVSNQAGTGSLLTTKGINLVAAKVLDYATSSATT